MYNKDKIIKAAIIVGFLLIFLLFMPFALIDKPDNQDTADSAANVYPQEEQGVTTEVQQPMTQQIPDQTNSAYEKMHNNGVNYYNQRDYLNAITMFNEALRIKPDNKLDTYYLALCESKMHDYTAAESKFASAESAYGNKKEYWLARAMNAKNIKDDEFRKMAQTYIQQAHELDSSDIQILYSRAQILREAYNSYKKAYNVPDGHQSLENPKTILLNAYYDLQNEAEQQGNEQYAELAQNAIEKLQSYSNQQQIQQGNQSLQAQQQPIISEQQNISVSPADIEAIENLPEMR